MTTIDTASLDSILSNLATKQAAEVAAAVRGFFDRLLGGSAAAPSAEAAPAKRRGRPPKAVAQAAPVARGGKRARADRSYSDDDIARTIEAIRSKPGLLPSQYRDVAKVDEKAWDRLIVRLKQDGKIKVTGGGRKTSYVLTSAPAPAAPAAKEARPVKVAAKAAPGPKSATPKKAKSAKRKAITEGELRAVLDVIAKKPGLTSVEIQKAAGIDAKQAARVLGKLREKKAVKWAGDRSRATYSVG